MASSFFRFFAIPAAVAALVCCGGAVAPIGSSGPDGGPTGDEAGPAPEASVVDSPGPADGPPTVDVARVPDASLGVCQPDGVACFEPSQCCSNICSGETCASITTPQDGGMMVCEADGSSCTSPDECCSGTCNGTCGAPMPSCPVATGASACEVCVANSCCSEVVACDGDLTCLQAERCFITCGAGAGCAQSCLNMYPSASAESLFDCAAESCAASCG